jgi:hypothetical protein
VAVGVLNLKPLERIEIIGNIYENTDLLSWSPYAHSRFSFIISLAVKCVERENKAILRSRDTKGSRADPVGALFVFLNLLKGEPEATGQLYLRDACFPATQTDSPPHRCPRSWQTVG